jgi:glycosyltransferase involved in cell wall biosynthesis
MTYLLTIAIPTYNRAIFLAKQLERLKNQIQNHGNVEILICDNCSSDNTKLIAQSFKQFSSNVTYIQQERNIGLDGNILSCYENAKGKYIWFLSDDDIIFDDAVSRVCDFISSQEFSVAAFSFCDNNRIKDCNKEIKYYRQYNDFLDSMAVEDFFKVIMISTLVVKKLDLDINYLKALEPTIFPQITLCLMILKKEFRLIANNMNILFREPGYVTGNFFELYCLKPRMAIKNAQLKSDDEKKLLNHTEKSLREFIKLSVLERIGFYKSKVGLPFKSFVKGFQEYKSKIRNIIFLILIYIISKTPRIILLPMVIIAVFLKEKSFKKAINYQYQLVEHIEKNILKSRSSDV